VTYALPLSKIIVICCQEYIPFICFLRFYD
jgi:hypothetical protein